MTAGASGVSNGVRNWMVAPRRSTGSTAPGSTWVGTVFEKVGVSSRGELVAKLFAEHSEPVHLDPKTHAIR
jgi:hypothetical protein